MKKNKVFRIKINDATINLVFNDDNIETILLEHNDDVYVYPVLEIAWLMKHKHINQSQH